MGTKEALKQVVCDAIDQRRERIIELGEHILRNPETGFNEHRTAALVARELEQLELQPQAGLAITGVKGRLTGANAGPRIAILGELDSLKVADHPHADPVTGAAHACGHNAQIAGMIGAAMGLQAAGAARSLAGEVVLFAVPAEEFIEVEARLQLVQDGKLELMTGKAELVAKGHFDDIDMSMMVHTIAGDGPSSMLVDSSNGALIKQVRFIGKPAHAGAVPQLGINALNAATIALHAIGAQRETFWEKDSIRVHPIITKGGDAVSVVPAEVCMETFVRGASIEAIIDANAKVDRCLRAGALAMGAEVEIHTIPGYLPQRNHRTMGELFGRNVDTLFGSGRFQIGGHRTGCTDMGDLGHLMPVIHPYVSGAEGVVHGNTWRIQDPEQAYVAPAKLLAMTVIDLLYGDAEPAKEVLEGFEPKLSKDGYLSLHRDVFKKERWPGLETQ